MPAKKPRPIDFNPSPPQTAAIAVASAVVSKRATPYVVWRGKRAGALAECAARMGDDRMSLKGKVAIVTGSTSGIGLGIAHALAAEGAAITLNGFGDAAEIEILQQAIAEKHGVVVRYSAADMTDADQIATMVAEARENLGGVDILVNNAGIQFTAEIEHFPADRWNAVIAINLSAAFHAMHAAIPLMKQAGWGRIINIASAHGLVASAQKAAYVAAKHGIVGLTKVAGIELANAGITCNAICPGWVLTPLVQKQIDARAEREGRPVDAVKRDLLAEKQPMLDFSTPDQIGAMSVFLCSEAAKTITGTTLSIDGGWTAG
jgi:3-hydroxybutyrate dehydrogenase